MQLVRQASLHPIDMCLAPLRSDDDTRAAKIGEVCEHQEESSKIEECREGKLREVESSNVRAKGLAACDGGLVRNRDSLAAKQRGNFGGTERQLRKIGEDFEERGGGELAGFHSYRANEGLEMRVGLEEVAEVKDLVPALEVKISDEYTESVRMEVAACEGEVEEGLDIVTRMADDSLDEFPRQ